jgi:hypothetical protein
METSFITSIAHQGPLRICGGCCWVESRPSDYQKTAVFKYLPSDLAGITRSAIVPFALLKLKDPNGIIKSQKPTALLLLIPNSILLHLCVFRF